MNTPSRIFFCDNCSNFRPSKKYWVRVTENSIITHDECEYCGVLQEIEEIDSVRRIGTHRIKNKEGKK